MNNSTGFVITGLVLGIAALAAGGIYFSNKSKTNLPPPTTNYGVYDNKQEEGYFYSGGKKTKKRHGKHRHKTIKHYK